MVNADVVISSSCRIVVLVAVLSVAGAFALATLHPSQPPTDPPSIDRPWVFR